MAEEIDVRKRFASELRSHRELHGERGLTQTELAKMVRTSRSTVSRLEASSGHIPPDIPRRLDEVFETDGLFNRLYEEIESQGFPAHSRRRLALESKALTIREWSPTVVPGLLQTASYAYALLREGLPRASEAEIQNKVRQRMDRQELWRGASPPDLSVVVCESVIRRRVGSEDTMRKQLSALLNFAEKRTSLLQVLPLDAGTHSLMDGSLSILGMPGEGMIAYTEGVRSGSIIDEPTEVRALARSYDVLSASALSRERSARMIKCQLEAS
ncbi:helix-turn-helix domain-containing protein [Streptomyces rubiginosohelvolus]|uniref:helix-turn-helix domain-containing protein n=1 Tax=Streptomyces rubiginosohelvolus TaxID=67362 RepID=UPI00381E6B97